jgi:hypothetical protein
LKQLLENRDQVLQRLNSLLQRLQSAAGMTPINQTNTQTHTNMNNGNVCLVGE